ncbi:MAG: carbohydrate-binding domain-containing protein [Ruminococcaceae bacterium]|nr:carbohydrate-binding domain-containing protein [Oscillospiraceae bacterium]
MKRILSIFLCFILLLSAVSCKKKNNTASSAKGEDKATGESQNGAQPGEVEKVTIPSLDLDFSGEDSDDSYDSDAVAVVFSDSGITISGEGALSNGTQLSIISAGTYILSGKCADGKITVNIGENEKAKLVLNGLNLTCQSGAALLIREGDKVFLTLAEESENTISDGGSYTETIGESNVDGAVFSRADMTINGSGKLTVNGNNKHGIVSKDDLIFSDSGSVMINAQGVGAEGKDCVKIREMTLIIESSGDGIRSTNTEDAARGFVYVESGNITVNAKGDAIQAETLLQISGGEFMLKTGGGADAAPQNQGNDMMGGGFRPGGNNTNSATDGISCKGLKCSATVLINGGILQIDAYDDGIHSDSDVGMGDGEVQIASGDDGIHAESMLEIAGGSLSISKSYEGLEAYKIYIKGGNISLVSVDDGLNASDGNGSMGGFGGMMGGMGGSEAYLQISGGYLFVNAGGDGLDSNGNFDFTGGIVLVSGPTNSGNGALDYGEGCSANVSGGVLIAVGSMGMAENFRSATGQGSVLVSTGSCSAWTNIAVCDANGKVIASFTPPKSYQCAVITAPGIVQGGTYTIYTGGSVDHANGNGFAENSTLLGGNKIATVEMTSLIFESGSGMGGGMPPPSGGGMRPDRR